ncbi:hypothetical protein [Clostridium estertheticum]|uniref:hypothetical protein n=1 Tax=Clostridium estertheticum TaxID=238834 RepID=UPI001CF1FAD4|nr:hypothetical protein [Clostridium estertheticum]MCB2355764.1 hypothetical protein [Clostridium estertheticum]WAG39350.1 hypothetical protein LL065_13670 [Clostridium estertheticum]
MITDKEIEKKILDIRRECSSLHLKGDKEGALKKIKDGWDILPYPKTSQDMSYLVLERFFNLCIEYKEFELANKWISLIFVSALIRVDDGDREFIAGKLAYEQGDLDVAKELFIIANIKSEGHLFKGKDGKTYRYLLK